MCADFSRYSVIVPALNEAAGIAACLRALAPLRAGGGELIVVDGGSADGTKAVATPWADKVIDAPRGRATQMNAGAAMAGGEVLCFVHADTQMSPDAMVQLARVQSWGRFDVSFSGRIRGLRMVAWMMNKRSCLTGVVTGDQCLFIPRALFKEIGGFPVQPLMEDVEISKRLRRHARPHCLRGPVITDSRRWASRGIWPTIVLMWFMRLAYFLGAKPERLAQWYR